MMLFIVRRTKLDIVGFGDSAPVKCSYTSRRETLQGTPGGVHGDRVGVVGNYVLTAEDGRAARGAPGPRLRYFWAAQVRFVRGELLRCVWVLVAECLVAAVARSSPLKLAGEADAVDRALCFHAIDELFVGLDRLLPLARVDLVDRVRNRLLWPAEVP